jgi:hypothetical protein
MGIWACSGIAGLAMRALAAPRIPPLDPLRYCVLYYPVLVEDEPLMQLTACARETPLLVVRAGEESPEVDRHVERFIHAMEECGGTIAVLIHPRGLHGFDVFNKDDVSTEIIARTLAYIKAVGPDLAQPVVRGAGRQRLPRCSIRAVVLLHSRCPRSTMRRVTRLDRRTQNPGRFHTLQ